MGLSDSRSVCHLLFLVFTLAKNPLLAGIEFHECDVSDATKVRKTVTEVIRSHGSLSVLVNSAGIVHGKTILKLTDEEINRTIDVNLKGTIWVTRCEIYLFLYTPCCCQHHDDVIVTSSAFYIVI